jgi:hypothetical protein
MIGARDDGTRVVARFTDGRMLKGTTHDFAPLKTQFHVYESGNVAAQTTRVNLTELKAVFFVRTFEGDAGHVTDNEVAEARGQGRRVRVTFYDGEVVAGFTMGFSEDKPGFFLIPADAACNNARVFVVRQAVRSIEWVAGPVAAVTRALAASGVRAR